MNKIISALAIMTIFTAAYAPFPKKNHNQEVAVKSINLENGFNVNNDSTAQTNSSILSNPSSGTLASL